MHSKVLSTEELLGDVEGMADWIHRTKVIFMGMRSELLQIFEKLQTIRLIYRLNKLSRNYVVPRRSFNKPASNARSSWMPIRLQPSQMATWSKTFGTGKRSRKSSLQ